FHAEDVIDGDPIFQRMRPAGVSGHIATDGAGALAAGVRGVMIPRAFQRLSEPYVHHAGLHHGVAITVVDLEDFPHPREDDHHAAADRQTAPGQTRPRAPWDERNVILPTSTHD